jgi:hypothetical protein
MSLSEFLLFLATLLNNTLMFYIEY